LANSVIIEKHLGKQYEITTDYNGIGKLQYIAGTMNLTIISTDYTDIVKATLLIPPDSLGAFQKKVTEATNGRANMEELEDVYYAFLDQEILIENA